MKYKIWLYTLCYNEMDILPFCVDYWVKLGVEKVIVFDNYSTDGSDKYLKKFPWIEVRKFNSGNGMNDIIHQQIKNRCWTEAKGKADFVIVCDCDEWLWSNDLETELDKMKEGGYNVLGNKWYALTGDKPLEQVMNEYRKENKYLHQILQRGYQQYINHQEHYHNFGKFLLIDPNKIDYINWSVGQHILFGIKPYFKLYVSDKIFTFHLNKGFNEDYYVNRRIIMADRLSDMNKMYGMGVEYFTPEGKTRLEYRANKAKSIDLTEL